MARNDISKYRADPLKCCEFAKPGANADHETGNLYSAPPTCVAIALDKVTVVFC